MQGLRAHPHPKAHPKDRGDKFSTTMSSLRNVNGGFYQTHSRQQGGGHIVISDATLMSCV